jgi:hypothetical protein
VTSPDPRRERLALITEQKARQAALIGEHGMPEAISGADALAQAAAARVFTDPAVTADVIYASIYRDGAAASAWLESNRDNFGHPALAKVPLSDGRVIGVIDLRPALQRAREES